MKARKWMWVGLMSMGALPSWSLAQAPAGIAAGAGLGPAAAGPTTAAAAQPQTIWSSLGISKPQLLACRYEKCATPCGQFINKMTMPLAAFTGGIIPGFCPLMPSPAELADQGAVGAAAKIKAEEAQAKARKAAMRYLGTVDCMRFPDAQDALIMGLRGDTNECVRFEAALALGNGCCCTKATMEALSISASCSDRDGKPREYSDRVRAASASALERCLSCYVDPNPPKVEKVIEGKPEEGPKDLKPEELKVPGDKKNVAEEDKDAVKNTSKEKAPRPVGLEYYRKIESVPRNQIVEEGRRVMAKYNETTSAAAVLKRESSVIGMINQAMTDTNATSSTVMENGVSTAKAEVVSARPQNLWEMVTRSAEPTGVANHGKADVVVKSSVEPPTIMAKSAPITMPVPMPMPMPSHMDTMPVLPEPTIVKSEPVIIKPMKPAETGGYGETGSIRPKTPAELASQPHPANTNVVATPAKTSAPNPLPATVTAKDSTKLTERESLKPVETPKPIVAKPPEPVVAKPAEPAAVKPAEPAVAKPAEPAVPTPTPLAQRVLTVMTEPNPASVRDQLAASLTKADFDSCPDITPVLVELARSSEADSTRKAAIQALVRNQVNSPAVLSTLEKLADDAPPTVRVEAAIGLARLKVGK
jgi:hypothetical protein